MSTDVFTPHQRAAVMRAVKSRNTKPELLVRAALRDLGFARRYRLGGAGLPGKPDIAFPRLQRAILVHGCFWHGHDCARGARKPKANADYWAEKISRNRARDGAVIEALAHAGWSTLVVWECALRDPAALSDALQAFLAAPASAPRISASKAPAPERPPR